MLAGNISKTWVHWASGIMMELDTFDDSVQGLIRKQGENLPVEIIKFRAVGTQYVVDDRAHLSLLNPIIGMTPTGKAFLPNYSHEQLCLTKIDECLEINLDGTAWVLASEDNPAEPLDEISKKVLFERRSELFLEDQQAKNDDAGVAEDDIKMPDWWTEEDTAKLLEELQKEIEEKIDEEIEDTVLESMLEKALAEKIAEKLAEQEAKIIADKLIQKGKDPAEAKKIAKRLAKTLKEDYLYKRSNVFKKIWNNLTYKKLRDLLTSPSKAIRKAVGKFFVKLFKKIGTKLGRLVLGPGAVLAEIADFISDIIDIGRMIYHGYKALEAGANAREQAELLRESEKALKEFFKNLTDEEREALDEHYRKQKEFFEEFHKEQKRKIKDAGRIHARGYPSPFAPQPIV